MRVDQRKVTDIDYFTFPTIFLETKSENLTENYLMIRHKKLNAAKKLAATKLIEFSKWAKDGKANFTGQSKFPPAIETLRAIRVARKV